MTDPLTQRPEFVLEMLANLKIQLNTDTSDNSLTRLFSGRQMFSFCADTTDMGGRINL